MCHVMRSVVVELNEIKFKTPFNFRNVYQGVLFNIPDGFVFCTKSTKADCLQCLRSAEAKEKMEILLQVR